MNDFTLQAITALKDVPMTLVLLYLLLRFMTEEMKLVEYLETITTKLIDGQEKLLEKFQEENTK